MFANNLQAYVQISPTLGLIADRLQLKQVRSLHWILAGACFCIS